MSLVRLPRRTLRTLLDLLALAGITLFVVSTRHNDGEQSASSAVNSSVLKVKQILATSLVGRSIRNAFPSRPTDAASESTSTEQLVFHPSLICPTCISSALGEFAASPYFSSVPLVTSEEARALLNDVEAQSLLKRYLVHHIPLAATISKAWMWDKSQNIMLNSYLSSPDRLVSFDFKGLDLDKPTAYIYTRTGGKKLDVEKRLEYFRMHHEMVHDFQDIVKQRGYTDGAAFNERQLIYLVVRDESQLDPSIEEFFREGSIRETFAACIAGIALRTSLSIYLLCSRTNNGSWHRSMERCGASSRSVAGHILWVGPTRSGHRIQRADRQRAVMDRF